MLISLFLSTLTNMYILRFNGRFELNDPDKFLQSLQELIKQQGVEYFGKIQTENLGEYVDFQKIEEPEIEDKKDE